MAAIIHPPDDSPAHGAARPDLSVEAEVRAYLRGAGSTAPPETLVAIIRDQWSRNHTLASEDAMRLLLGRQIKLGVYEGGHCEGIIRNQARRFGFHTPPDRLDEFRSRCWARIWDGVLADQPFWEERFGRAVKMRAIDVGRKMSAEARPAKSAAQSLPGSYQAGSPEGDLLNRIDSQRLRIALADLPPRQRQAVWLRYIQDLPIESRDDDGSTVSGTMGISSSMVRRHLRAGIQTLRSNPEVAMLLEERDRSS